MELYNSGLNVLTVLTTNNSDNAGSICNEAVTRLAALSVAGCMQDAAGIRYRSSNRVAGCTPTTSPSAPSHPTRTLTLTLTRTPTVTVTLTLTLTLTLSTHLIVNIAIPPCCARLARVATRAQPPWSHAS